MVNWSVVDLGWGSDGTMDGDKAVWFLLGEHAPIKGVGNYEKRWAEKGGDFFALRKALLVDGAIEKKEVSVFREGSGYLRSMGFSPYRTPNHSKTKSFYVAHKDKLLVFYEKNPSLGRPPFLFEDVRQAASSEKPYGWPWGNHETKLLGVLAATVKEFWADPADEAAATNEFICDWILQTYKGDREVSENIAKAIATIIRPPMPVGRRKRAKG